jgi:heme-degrading monooxygenase HmoA
VQRDQTVLEVAILNVLPSRLPEFETAFGEAQSIISSMPGYQRHELRRCVEAPARYLLLVWWDELESHTVGFRGSPEYAQWKARLHHFYEPFPEVEHYTPLFEGAVSR